MPQEGVNELAQVPHTIVVAMNVRLLARMMNPQPQTALRWRGGLAPSSGESSMVGSVGADLKASIRAYVRE